MSHSDEQLAEHLEGLLEPEASRSIDAAAQTDPDLAARLESLRGVFGDAVTLPEVTLPERLEGRVAARLAASPPDGRLAEQIEGLLDDEAAQAVEEAALADDAVAARAGALGAVLTEPVTLPAVPLPEGLADRVLQRLAEESLLVDQAAVAASDELGDAAVPAGLLDATLGRLEREGLVAASAGGGGGGPAGEVIAFPRRGVPLRWVAAVVAALGLGLVAGRGTAPAGGGDLAALQASLATAQAERLEATRQRDALRTDLAAATGARDEAVARTTSLEQELAAARQATPNGSELQAALAARTAELKQTAAEAAALANEVAGLKATVADREAALAQARQAPTPADGRVPELEAALAKLERALSEREEEVTAVRVALAESERQAAELTDALADAGGAAPTGDGALAVGAATAVERWDGDAGAWTTVEASAKLPAGTLVRGKGTQSALTTGGRNLALRGGMYVVNASYRIEPLPADTANGQRWSAAPRYEAEDAAVPDLLMAVASGSPRARARAQQALRRLYRRYGGGDGMPATAHGWAAWWENVAPVAAGYASR